MIRALPLLLAAALLLPGCASAGLAPAPAMVRPAGATLRLRLALAPAPDRSLLATLRRWTAADVAGFKVVLTRHDGDGWVPVGEPIAVPVPEADGPIKATFAGLASGQAYRASVEAWGEPGGAAATTWLNAAKPCTAEFDLTGYDLGVPGVDTHPVFDESVVVALDDTPFSGTVTLTPEDLPAGTAALTGEVWLDGGGAAIASQTVAGDAATFTFQDLAAGPTYVFKLIARDADGDALASATSDEVRFDPTAATLDPERALTVSLDD